MQCDHWDACLWISFDGAQGGAIVLNQSEDRPLVAFMTNEAPHLVCGEMPAHDATVSIWLHGLARSRRSQRMT